MSSSSSSLASTSDNSNEERFVHLRFKEWNDNKSPSKALSSSSSSSSLFVYESVFDVRTLDLAVQNELRLRCKITNLHLVIGGAERLSSLSGYDEDEMAMMTSMIEDVVDEDVYDDTDDDELSWKDSLTRAIAVNGGGNEPPVRLPLFCEPSITEAVEGAVAVHCFVLRATLSALIVGTRRVLLAQLDSSDLCWRVVSSSSSTATQYDHPRSIVNHRGAAIVACGSTLLVFGGAHVESNVCHSDLWQFDFADRRWSLLSATDGSSTSTSCASATTTLTTTSMPQARSFAAVAMAERCLFVCGGDGGEPHLQGNHRSLIITIFSTLCSCRTVFFFVVANRIWRCVAV